MKNILTTIITSTIICLIIGAVGYSLYINKTPYGAEIPAVIALFEDSLAGKIASTSTSMTLVSGTDGQSRALSGKYGFYLSGKEFVIADCDGVTCTNMLRGIDVVDGQSEVGSLAKPHRRGASVKMTNFPILAILARQASGSESYEDLLYYSETLGTTEFSGIASTSNLATKYYVDVVGAGGFTSINVGTNDGLWALSTSPETVGVNLASSSGLHFLSEGDLAVYPSTSFNSLVLDSFGRISVGTGSFTFEDTFFLTYASVSQNLDIIGTLSTTHASISDDLTLGSRNIGKSFSFGGDGSDGVKTVASSENIDASNATVVVKQYSSLVIDAGQTLGLINASTSGTTLIIKVSGDATINGTIDLSGDGASGGTGGQGGATNSAAGANGTSGTEGGDIIDDLGTHKGLFGVGGDDDDEDPDGGATATALLLQTLYANQYRYAMITANGSGGGGGGGGEAGASGATFTGGDGGDGGNGGGVIILEVAGDLTFGASASISANGENGEDGEDGTCTGICQGGGGGGGGGAGGVVVILYNGTLTDGGLTYTADGGDGGLGGDGMIGSSPSTAGGHSGGGGSGGGGIIVSIAGGDGEGNNDDDGGDGGAGGAGAAGFTIFQKNYTF